MAFTRLWTMKEAVFKQRGTGITGDIRQVLTGVTGILTIVNEAKGYVFSVCQENRP